MSNLPDLPSDINALTQAIQLTLDSGKKRALRAIENEKKRTYWTVGKQIKTHLLQNESRADYGKMLFKQLSLSLEIPQTTLYKCVSFHTQYPKISQTSSKLTWSHVVTLLSVESKKERDKYESKVIENKLSVRELHAEIKADKPALLVPTSVSSQLLYTRQSPYVYGVVTINDRPMLDLGFNIQIEKPPQKVTVSERTHYVYKATVLEVIDGDTLWVHIDLGFGPWTRQKVRFRGINTAEIESPEGMQAQAFVETILKRVPFVVLRSYWRDKFSRYLVDVFYLENESDFLKVVKQGRFLNQELLDEGVATLY